MSDGSDALADGGDEATVVVHDGAIHPGGAVAVAVEAAKALDADLVVGFSGVDPEWWAERVPNDVDVLTRRSRKSFLKDVRVAWKLLNIDLSDYDVVVTSGPSAKFYQPTDAQRVYHYLHHPPLAVLWGARGLRAHLTRTIDRIETSSIANLIANSELTADRIRTHYNRSPAAVIHPPVDIDRFSATREKQSDEVVLVGRLEARKRPDVAVEAFERLAEADTEPPTLHVLGDGPLRTELERRAPENVTFHGYVDDSELVERLERASAGLFLSRREDFGMTPIEYMAAGTPVVGVDEPNTNNQVTEGESGTLVAPTPSAVADGVRSVLGEHWNPETVRDQAAGYAPERFRDEIRGIIDR